MDDEIDNKVTSKQHGELAGFKGKIHIHNYLIIMMCTEIHKYKSCILLQR